MRYKAILLDVDGTLVGFGQDAPTPAVVAAVGQLQKQGVRVIVATGRGPSHIDENFLGGILPDYVIAFNGAYIMDAAGNALFASPMSEEQFALVETLGRQGHPVGYSFDDGYYLYHNAEKLVTLSGATAKDTGKLRLHFDDTRHTRGMPYVSFCNYPDALAPKFNQDNPTLKLVYHRANTYDLCQAEHNKATAATWLLKDLGLDWQDVVAIGDGGNDMEMLQAAGLGIAMGNAPDFLKEAAGHVTDTVERDGVAAAIRQFFPQDNQ